MACGHIAAYLILLSWSNSPLYKKTGGLICFVPIYDFKLAVWVWFAWLDAVRHAQRARRSTGSKTSPAKHREPAWTAMHIIHAQICTEDMHKSARKSSYLGRPETSPPPIWIIFFRAIRFSGFRRLEAPKNTYFFKICFSRLPPDSLVICGGSFFWLKH